MSAPNTQQFELWQLCGYVGAASWVIMVWEGILTFPHEVKFIWPMPYNSRIKWLYICGKYLALALQTAVVATQMYLADHGTSLYYCRVYRFVEMLVSTILMLCFDIVLLLRVYALYGLRTPSSAVATGGVLVEIVASIASMIFTIPESLFDSRCVMVDAPKTILLFVVGVLISQTILLWLVFHKREHAIRARSSIACVTIRDGFMVFLCFAAFLVIVLIWTLHNSPATTLMIFWIPTVTSVATCRIILNLHHTQYTQTVQEFTTEIWGPSRSADSYLLSDGPFQRDHP